ncbi:MAG: polysaccharide biosynthesis tyrosine autokinase [Parvibaculum sp.]|uniref:polysaccharide biosynthesis tyrosine autokinase n=1 Tax=Parvibaculum sp. TaxID=2024848 RepID=UPI0025D43E09|nr:polysaccharide biosynthesis tyrosine autokinase [Parvibaculum sp.]MCE9649108.1 polysaccharide biosynthesis tyrosine autokinase [Parvibaculum sp.]
MKNSSSQLNGGVYGDVQVQEDSSILDFDLVGLLRSLRRRLGLIIGITVGLTALALVGIFQVTPLYTGEAMVLLNMQKTQVIDIEAVMSGLTADSATIDSEVEILRSRSIARKVIEKLNLMNDPEINRTLAPATFISEINPLVWIGSIVGKKQVLTDAEQQAALLNAAIDTFLSGEKITRNGLTYVVSVTFNSESSQKAANIANAIADTYILDQLEAKFDATKRANEWLSQRLDGLRHQVQESERAMEIYRSASGLEGADGVTINEQQLSELNAQLILARADLAEKQAKYTRAKQILTSGGSIESVVDVLQSKTISDLRQREAEIARQQADLSSKYGPRHPSIVNAEAQRKDIVRQIGAEVQRIVAGIQNESAIAQSRVSALETSLHQLQSTAGQNNQALIRLRELTREAAANRTVYESFLGRFKETSQQQDLQTSDARVISAATPPQRPSYPRKGIVLFVALVLSGAVGVGVALLLERLDNALKTRPEIEEALGMACLGSIPETPNELDKDGKRIEPPNYVLLKPLSAFAESLRSLRSALSLSNVDNPPKIILFTSALPDEGKTTTAVSFARAAAHAGISTLLIDCDLRHPSVHKTLGVKAPKEGIVELLASRADMEQAIQRDEPSGLAWLAVAAGAANPPDVLGSAQMKHLLADAREKYDLVILDTAPVLPVADSRVLSKLVDKVVFVTRWSQTPRDAAQSAVKELRNFHADIAGAVLTVVDTAKQAKYGYGDGGYYYRRYSRYYAN